MKFKIEYNKEKNQILKQTRGVGLDEIIEAIKRGNLLDDIDHFNKKRYPNQRIFIVKLKSKVYAVPYVFDKRSGKFFLKTAYPNRKLKKRYFKKIYEK